MKKFRIFIITIFLTPVIAGIYGILHDQLTYTLCEEYYTKFKFYQFGVAPNLVLTTPRLAVAMVGILATWWTGAIIGGFNALAGLMQKNELMMRRAITTSIIINIVITIIIGLAGLYIGSQQNSNTASWIPDTVVDKHCFMKIGYMHDAAYLGGVIGLMAGIIYQLYVAITDRKLSSFFNKKSR